MSSFRKGVLVALLAFVGASASAQSKVGYPGIGREATAKEIQAWDIDVRPDFKGLPVGSGSVALGQEVWEGKCASCHGVFGESNEVFNPIVGGTSKEDILSGRVARLKDASYPGRTTLMKLPTVATLWDYIHRAMPWTEPKSLTTQEVYAVTAFILNLGGVVPEDFTLSDKNIAEVQKRLPNRNGMNSAHAMWPGKELGGAAKPDVQGSACMSACSVEPRVASYLPDHARNAHGNLAEQNRLVGAQRGANTLATESGSNSYGSLPRSASAAPVAVAAASGARADTAIAKAAQALAQKHACTACHAADRKLVGPSWGDIARKYPGRADHLAGKIKSGGSGVWGTIAMPAQNLPDADARALAAWLAAGAHK
jgi:S-disulfanyl-L-cysteine oxidoreductase SoxD